MSGLKCGGLEFNGWLEGPISSGVPSIPAEHYHVEKIQGWLSTFSSNRPEQSSVLQMGLQGRVMLCKYPFLDVSLSIPSIRFLWSAMHAIAWLTGFSAVLHGANGVAAFSELWEDDIQVIGLSVTPHQFSPNMQWRRAPNPELSARVEMFVRNQSDRALQIPSPIRFDDKTPEELLAEKKWAWHDTSSKNGFELPAGALRVLRWNGLDAGWGVGTEHDVSLGGVSSTKSPINLELPRVFFESITFHAAGSRDGNHSMYPDRMLATIHNDLQEPIRMISCRLWLPQSNETFQTLYPKPIQRELKPYPEDAIIPAGEMGGIELDFGPLPLTYTAVEMVVSPVSRDEETHVWGYLKIRRSSFDISGGWVASVVKGRNSMTQIPFLKTLSQLYINTGQIEEVSGYTDNPELYAQYPIKRFNRMADKNRYDSDSILSTVHAIEFLGEPQYGGGRPVPPQEVFDQLAPYQSWKLPTTVTLSEERDWRYYVGVCDYPHYDAYRVIAPAADSWSKYDRWGGKSIRWGAPLETIGDMTRSLRQQSRPVTIAYWSQGAHHDWGGVLSPRRGSPTPDELRSQAWQGLGNGIASLYWFNLSMKSLAKFPDLIDPIRRVGREIQLLKPILEQCVCYQYERQTNDGLLEWDLNSLVTRDTALLVANDIGYAIDERSKTFRFEKRDGVFSFQLPTWLATPNDGGTTGGITSDSTTDGNLHVFRVDSEGTHNVEYTLESRQIKIRDAVSVVGVYIVTRDKNLRLSMDAKLASLLQSELELGFNPVDSEADRKTLQSLVD